MAIKSLLLDVQAGLAEDAQAAFPCGRITAQLPALAGRFCVTQGCCVHGELLFPGRIRLTHPASPLLLGVLLVPKDRALQQSRSSKVHLYDSQALVIRRSVRKALGIKGKGNSPASCSLNVPLERWLSPALHAEVAFAPTGCGDLQWAELLSFLLFVQGP